MIIVTHPSKPFTFTAKGTPRRQAILTAYSKEIDTAYEAVDKTFVSNIPAPQKWIIDDITGWIRRIVQSLLRTDAQISDTQNFFAVGVDRSDIVTFLFRYHRLISKSLIATAIRNTIVSTLRRTNIISISAIRILPQNFIFNNPSISLLSAFVQEFVLAAQANGKVAYPKEDPDDEDEPVVQFMKFPEPGETIIKLRKGKGEPPLIVLHGPWPSFVQRYLT